MGVAINFIKIIFIYLETVINPIHEYKVLPPHELENRIVVARNYNQYEKEVILPDTTLLIPSKMLKRIM